MELPFQLSPSAAIARRAGAQLGAGRAGQGPLLRRRGCSLVHKGGVPGLLWAGSSAAAPQPGCLRRKTRVHAQQQQQQQEPAGDAPTPVLAESDAAGAPSAESWRSLALWLFLAGFFLGPPLDGLHSVVGLQIYDGPAAITIGGPVTGLLTSLWVPPLLGVMYVVVGFLQLALDSRFPPPTGVPGTKRSATHMLTTLGVLVGLLRLSSLMYENALPSSTILGVLALASYGSWYCLDRTAPGFLLALAVGVGAPLCEVACLKLGFWHYSTPDVFVAGEGLVSWTLWCYFFYTQWVGAVARTLDAAFSPPPSTEGKGPAA